MTPDIAFTTVDFPCATCPIVPKQGYFTVQIFPSLLRTEIDRCLDGEDGNG